MQLIPILASRSLERSTKVYRSFGFEPVYRQQVYLVLRSAALELHFAHRADLDPLNNPAAAYLTCESAAELSTLWVSLAAHRFPDLGVPRLTRPELRPGGLCEFDFVDQDGNLLRIGSKRSG